VRHLPVECARLAVSDENGGLPHAARAGRAVRAQVLVEAIGVAGAEQPGVQLCRSASAARLAALLIETGPLVKEGGAVYRGLHGETTRTQVARLDPGRLCSETDRRDGRHIPHTTGTSDAPEPTSHQDLTTVNEIDSSAKVMDHPDRRKRVAGLLLLLLGYLGAAALLVRDYVVQSGSLPPRPEVARPVGPDTSTSVALDR